MGRYENLQLLPVCRLLYRTPVRAAGQQGRGRNVGPGTPSPARPMCAHDITSSRGVPISMSRSVSVESRPSDVASHAASNTSAGTFIDLPRPGVTGPMRSTTADTYSALRIGARVIRSPSRTASAASSARKLHKRWCLAESEKYETSVHLGCREPNCLLVRRGVWRPLLVGAEVTHAAQFRPSGMINNAESGHAAMPCCERPTRS
jgi:hypothetical protein